MTNRDINLLKNRTDFLLAYNQFLESQKGRISLIIPVIFALGIASFFSLNKEPELIKSAYLLIATIIIFYIAKFCNREILSKFLLATVIFALGFFNANLESSLKNHPKIEEDLGVIWLRGNVEKIEKKENFVRLTISNNDLWQPETKKFPSYKTPEKIRLNIRTAVPNSLSINDYIQVKVILSKPPDLPVFPGGYDFSRWAYFQEIGAVGYSIDDVKILEDKQAGFTENIRSAISEKIDDNVENKVNSAIVKALTLADRSEIPQEVTEQIRASGLGHLLAISGLHMSIVMIWSYVFIRLFLSLSETIALNYQTKKIAAIFALIAGFSYLMITQMPISATRAYIMLSIYFLAILTERNHVSLRPLALAGLIILVFRPSDIITPSFQMSFAAVAGLIGFYQKYQEISTKPKFKQWNQHPLKKLFLYLCGVVVTTIIASVVTSPISIYHFNNFSKMGTIANLIAIPLTSFVIMPSLMIANLLSLINLEWLIYPIVSLSVGLMVAIAESVSSVENSVFHIPAMPQFLLPVSMLIIFLAAFFRGKLGFILSGLLIIPFCFLLFYRVTPEVLISDDGKLFAIKHDEDEYKFYGSKRKKYIISRWFENLGLDETDKDEIFKEEYGHCNKDECKLEEILISRNVKPEDCENYKIVIDVGKSNQKCNKKSLETHITLDQLNRYGTHAIYNFFGKYKVINSKELKGYRNW